MLHARPPFPGPAERLAVLALFSAVEPGLMTQAKVNSSWSHRLTYNLYADKKDVLSGTERQAELQP